MWRGNLRSHHSIQSPTPYLYLLLKYLQVASHAIFKSMALYWYRRTITTLSHRTGVIRGFSSPRDNRHAAMQQKQKELFSMIDSHQDAATTTNSSDAISKTEPHTQEKEEQRKRLEQERKLLFHEAGVMTKSLYRSNLRCVNLIREGNQHDVADFEAREEEQKSERLNTSISASFSFQPPVDRNNELSSRALYYLAFAKESFNQEVDCLVSDPWREENLTRFLYLIRQGEERRKWVLEDYKFVDPYPDKWDEDSLVKWEDSAWKLIRETYKLNGWLFKDDFANDDKDYVDEGIDWDEDDNVEERKIK